MSINTGIIISKYVNNDFNLIIPLLAEEFKNWSIEKIKSYINIVLKNHSNGILVAKNDALYNVGLLIYSFQEIEMKTLKKNELSKCLVVENLIASSPVLEKMVYLLLIENAVNIAEKNNCTFLELPRLDDSFSLIKNKYNNGIVNLNGWRTFLKLEKISAMDKAWKEF
tara:strand:- start:312 stop:815 length:504 start_codon:yes stop_codon:yes gene_type:complete